jgi:hypothetical protein
MSIRNNKLLAGDSVCVPTPLPAERNAFGLEFIALIVFGLFEDTTTPKETLTVNCRNKRR